jgi:hypothetical protein
MRGFYAATRWLRSQAAVLVFLCKFVSWHCSCTEIEKDAESGRETEVVDS